MHPQFDCDLVAKQKANELAQLRTENEKLAAALVAKDEALEALLGWVDDWAETSDTDFPRIERQCDEALDLKPHAALVAKLKAEAVREFLEREKKWTINEAILAKIKADAVREFVDSAMPTKLLQKLGHEYADRIEREV